MPPHSNSSYLPRARKFYANWAGFENGEFLSYLEENVLDPSFTVQYQPNENNSCPYAFTDAAWDTYMDVPDSNRAAVPSPGAGPSIPSRCVETYVANKNTGRPGLSLLGEPYDCRNRVWYYANKGQPKARWSPVFLDSATNEASFAYCEPLFNLSTSAPKFFNGLAADPEGMVGVACTAMEVQALSEALLSQFDDLSAGGSGSFIVERSSGLLIAASTSVKDEYFDAGNSVRQAAATSPSDVIRFAAATIQDSVGAGNDWPSDFTTTAWVTRADTALFPALTAGDAYYVGTLVMFDHGLVWCVASKSTHPLPWRSSTRPEEHI